MIEGAALKLILGAAIGLGLLSFAYLKGRSHEKNKQLKKAVHDTIEIKKRKSDRNDDDISDVKQRMRKYVRK